MHFMNPEYAAGTFHTIEGLLMMGFGLLLLNVECWILDQLNRRRGSSGESAARAMPLGCS
jgi:hypothetical protein